MWLFYVYASLAVVLMGSAMIMANAVHALLTAVLSFLCLAMSFYVLSSPLAAVLEVIVYAGAIMVLFVFAVMLMPKSSTSFQSKTRVRLALLAVVLFMSQIGFALMDGLPTGKGGEQSINDIALSLFKNHWLVLELISFVLLAALVAAILVGQNFINQKIKVRS